MYGNVFDTAKNHLKLVFIFSPNDSPSKTEKYFLFNLKRCFRSRDIQIFVVFSLPFHTFQIEKEKWK